jgi:hypothetical protein
VHAAEALFQVEAPVRDWPEMKREIEDARLQAGSLWAASSLMSTSPCMRPELFTH